MKELGQELRKTRLANKVRLRDITRKTKIQTKFLKAIEEGNFEILPEPYIRGFIKAYAKEIGFDVNEAIKKYERSKEERPQPEEKELSSAVTAAQGFKFSEHKAAATVLGAIIVGVSVIIYVYVKYGSDIFGTTGKEVKEIPLQAMVSNLDSARTVQKVKEEPLRLDLVALEKTWVRISVDNGSPMEYTFYKGNTRSWTATNRFTLRIGRADGLELRLNGKSLGDLGLSSQVIDLVLSKEGIVSERIIKVAKVEKDTTEFEIAQ